MRIRKFLAMVLLTGVVACGTGCDYIKGSQPSNPLSARHMVRAGEQVTVEIEKAKEEVPSIRPMTAGPLTALGVAAVTNLVGLASDETQKYIEWEVGLHQASYCASDGVSEFYVGKSLPKNSPLTPAYNAIMVKRTVPGPNNDPNEAFYAHISMTPVARGAPSLQLKLDSLRYRCAAAKLSGRDVPKQPVTIEIKLEIASSWLDDKGKWHDEPLSKPVVFTVQNVVLTEGTKEVPNKPGMTYVVPAPPVSVVGDKTINGNLRVTATVTETDQSKGPEIRKKLAAQLKELKQPITNVVIDLVGLPVPEAPKPKPTTPGGTSETPSTPKADQPGGPSQ
jgi:hypothetical protein